MYTLVLILFISGSTNDSGKTISATSISGFENIELCNQAKLNIQNKTNNEILIYTHDTRNIIFQCVKTSTTIPLR